MGPLDVYKRLCTHVIIQTLYILVFSQTDRITWTNVDHKKKSGKYFIGDDRN